MYIYIDRLVIIFKKFVLEKRYLNVNNFLIVIDTKIK